jgi:cytochrome d ubiquinol oxidase subunit I
MDRLFHTVCGAWQAGAFLVISVSAWYLLKKKHVEFCPRIVAGRPDRGAGRFAAAIISGHSSARAWRKTSRPSSRAFEGLYNTTSNAPLVLVGYVDEKNEKVVGIAIPDMLSLLVYREFNAVVTGLNDFAPARPSAGLGLVFIFSRHGGIGFTTIRDRRWAVFIPGAERCKKTLVPVDSRFFRAWSAIANQIGWFAAEVGRQPWLVYG